MRLFLTFLVLLALSAAAMTIGVYVALASHIDGVAFAFWLSVLAVALALFAWLAIDWIEENVW